MLSFRDDIPQIAGRVCQSLKVQEYWHRGELVDGANVLFLQLDGGIWHRFFIDAGVVFWRTVEMPDEKPDDGFDRYPQADLGFRHDLIGKKLERVSTIDLPGGGEIRIEFEGGATLLLRDVDDQSRLVVEK